MASRDGGGGGVSRQDSIELSSDSNAESESSYAGSGAGDEPHHEHDGDYNEGDAVCMFRSARFHDQECERYFDCPSHLVERVLSDRGQDAGQHAGEEDVHMADAEDHPEAGNVSPMSEDEEEQGSEVSPLPVVEMAGPARQEADEGVANIDADRAPTPPPRDDAPSGSAQNPIILLDSSTVRVRTDERTSPTGSRNTFRRHGDSNVLYDLRAGIIVGGDGEVNEMRNDEQRPPPTEAPVRRGPTELALPRWQPDAEVTYCPICSTQFSIFVRKHHCRKCGRVVCNACSPHRITIPYQYIVQPPWAQGVAPRYPTLPLGSDGTVPDFQSQFGGERVRLCNPCVPDPNITPPQTQGSHSRSQSGLPQAQPNAGQLSNRWSSYFGNPTSDPHVRSRSVTMVPGTLASSSRAPAHPYSQRPTEDRILSGTPPVANYYQYGQQGGQLGLAGRTMQPLSSQFRQRLSSQLPPLPGQQPLPPLPSGSHVPAQAQPPNQIAEEDECPVCHRELPSRTLRNFEALRESHITSCIRSHSAYSGAGSSSGEAASAAPGQPWPATRRRTGMFPYTATEKDCVDSAECSICLEEFEVGVAMARLECLCRFHRTCIDAWWERHPGRCPMHQHEDFGY